mgnify:CR=1 FL=1
MQRESFHASELFSPAAGGFNDSTFAGLSYRNIGPANMSGRMTDVEGVAGAVKNGGGFLGGCVDESNDAGLGRRRLPPAATRAAGRPASQRRRTEDEREDGGTESDAHVEPETRTERLVVSRPVERIERIGQRQQSRHPLQPLGHLVAGDFDYFLKIRVGDMADFNRIHGDQLIALPGVRQTRTFFVMKEVVDNAPLEF